MSKVNVSQVGILGHFLRKSDTFPSVGQVHTQPKFKKSCSQASEFIDGTVIIWQLCSSVFSYFLPLLFAPHPYQHPHPLPFPGTQGRGSPWERPLGLQGG